MRRVGDSIAVAMVLVAALVCWNPRTPWLRRGELYVSPTGSDWHLGTSPRWALATIQHAADRACPGERIVILPGTYRERVHVARGGLPDAPLVFQASQGGTATITNAVPAEVIAAWTWRGEGDGIYSTAPDWPIYWLMEGEVNFFHVKRGGLLAMRPLVLREHAFPTFCYERDRLYVFFADGRGPAQHRFSTHGRLPPPREWGVLRTANVRCEADDVRFEGLRFELGVGNGILVRRGNNIAVHDCAFVGTDVGVSTSWNIATVRELRVERCFYHNYPQREWCKGWLPSWDEVYAFYSSSTLVATASEGAVIRGNLVVHGADLLRVTNGDEEIHQGSDIQDNLLAWGTDDTIEFDGTAQQIHFHHNLVYDVHESLGTSPVLAGPVEIDHNLFLHPSGGVNGAQVKLINSWPASGPIRNIRIHHNTFVGQWLCWGTSPVVDVLADHNVFAVQYQQEPRWPPGVKERENTYIALSPDGYPNPGRDPQWFRNATDTASDARVEDYRGATPPQRTWHMPRPGPAWLDWSNCVGTARLRECLTAQVLVP